MKGRLTKDDEDSASDWDSMSEMEPPPKEPVIKPVQNTNQGQDASIPRKLKSMTFVDPAAGIEKPPYDFKPEVPVPVRVMEEKPPKPGKSKKGKQYDPQDVPQRRVSFVDDLNRSNVRTQPKAMKLEFESDSEDPLYSTVKHKTPNFNVQSSNIDKQKEESEKSGRDGALKKFGKGSSKAKLMQGLDNQAFVEDEELPSVIQPTDVPVHDGKVHETESKNVSHRPSQKQEHIVRLQSLDGINTKTMQIIEKESTPPLILTLGQTSIESATRKPFETVNKAMAEACTFLAFPLMCFSLFLHHFLRLILQGVIRPLVVDSLVLVVEYLLRPLMNTVIKPVLLSVHGASTSLSDMAIVCLRPVTVVLQSFRLIEVNYTRKYSVDEI